MITSEGGKCGQAQGVGGGTLARWTATARLMQASMCPCAEHAPGNPVVAEHVVLPILHLLLEAIRPESARPSSKRPPKHSGTATGGATGAATDRAQPVDVAGSAAGSAGRPSTSRAAAPIPEATGGALTGSGVPTRSGKGGAKGAAAHARSAGAAGSPVSFSEFMSGRAGFAEYLARRTAAGAGAGLSEPARDLALR